MASEDIAGLSARAIALHGEGRYAEALACLHTLETQLKDNPALWSNLGIVYRDSGDLPRAEQYLRRVCAARPADPAAHFNLALTLLRSGQLREGFREYEWRWQLPQFAEQRRNFTQPLWRGEPLEGRRLLIYSEQGAGDAMQFVRYAPLLRAAGAHVIVEMLPHVERLATWMDGGFDIVNALTPGVEFDLQCPLISLPQRFATGLENIPPPARFSIPAAERARWLERIATPAAAVGVVWAGNPRHANDGERSLPPQHLARLANLPGVKCWSLQVGAAAVDLPGGIANLWEELTDFAETAAAICAMDLVITVDTAVAHLAGSLGKPVWLLLAYASDWRWLLAREDSPWYPTMRIFRQQRPGDWEGVLDRVVRARSGK